MKIPDETTCPHEGVTAHAAVRRTVDATGVVSFTASVHIVCAGCDADFVFLRTPRCSRQPSGPFVSEDGTALTITIAPAIDCVAPVRLRDGFVFAPLLPAALNELHAKIAHLDAEQHALEQRAEYLLGEVFNAVKEIHAHV